MADGWGWRGLCRHSCCVLVCLVVAASNHTHHKPFQFSDFTVESKNIGWLLRFTGIILKRILFRGESTPPDNLFTRTVAGKQGLIHLKKEVLPCLHFAYLFALTFSLFILPLVPRHTCGTRRNTSILRRRGCLPHSTKTCPGSRSVFRHRR